MPSASPLPLALQVVRDGIAEGLHPGAQVYVSLAGEPVADLAEGEAAAGVPMTPDTLLLWQSCTKPVVAICAAREVEAGRLSLDEPVATYVPEFGNRGKERVTVRHLLTHTGGFRFVMLRWFSQTWEMNFERLCNSDLEPGWEPGRKAGYHSATSWFLLAEVLRRLDGRPVERIVEEDVFEPLGLRDSWLAMSVERYQAYGERIGLLHETSSGEARTLPIEDSVDGCTIPRPGSSGRGPARELGRVNEALLRGGGGLVRPETVAAFTAPSRVGMFDHTFRRVVDWGLGFLVNTHPYEDAFAYSFGPYASRAAFGHGGHQSAISFADPAHGLVVAAVFNGMPGERKHARRNAALCAAVYRDLGLADNQPGTTPEGSLL